MTFQSKEDEIIWKIAYCEEKVDRLVYGLYGLGEEEIRIVEGKF